MQRRRHRRSGRVAKDRNPEVEDFDRAVVRDQDIFGFDVAVDDEPLMRVRDARAHLQQQREPGVETQLTIRTIACDRYAVDILHHEVRKSGRGGATIEEASDVRVIQPREELTLLLKAFLRVEEGLRQHLERHLLRECAVAPLGQIDGAHPTFAEQANQTVGADMAAGEVGNERRRDRGRRQEVAGLFVFVEQTGELARDRRIFAREPCQERGPLLGRKFERLTEEFGDLSPGFWG